MPEDYPPNLSATKQSSTSIKLMWGSLPLNSRKNGVIIGYRIRYSEKESSPKVWMNRDSTSRIFTVDNLKKYKLYEIGIAAKTSKGVGVYSPSVEERTKEDGMLY